MQDSSEGEGISQGREDWVGDGDGQGGVAPEATPTQGSLGAAEGVGGLGSEPLALKTTLLLNNHMALENVVVI